MHHTSSSSSAKLTLELDNLPLFAALFLSTICKTCHFKECSAFSMPYKLNGFVWWKNVVQTASMHNLAEPDSERYAIS